MKGFSIAAGILLLVVPVGVRPAFATEGFDDLVKVIKAGADDKALTAYIDASPVTYDLSVDEILFLSDMGLSAEMINAITNHGKKLAGEPVEASPAPAVTETTPTPTVTEAAPNPGADEAPPAVSLPPPEETVQEQVEEAPTVEAPPADQVDVSTFYDALSPYGSWINVDGNWYWQPTAMVVDSDWSPYCQNGHWVYTDCGWMWQSDYSWGWAPFHYGRWSRHPRYGWIWLPDTVWSPAWVSWRHSDNMIGWAPLPPAARFDGNVGFTFHGTAVSADFEFGLEAADFTFVSVAHFGDPRPAADRLARAELRRVYATTTIVRDSFVRDGNRIINRGPSVVQIQAATHRAIAQLRIVDQDIRPGQSIRRGRIAGNSVTIYRPQVAPVAPRTPQEVVASRQAEAQARRSQVRNSPVFAGYANGARVNAEQARGRASLQNAHPAARPPATATTSKAESRPGSRQTPMGIPAAQSQQDQRQRAAQMAKQQEAQRQAEEAAARQREEQQRRTVALAQQEEQRRRAVAQAPAQEEQRQRAPQPTQQQEQQRPAQEEQRQRAAQLGQQQEQQRQALQAQRQSEEAAARRQAQARSPQQPAPPRPQPSAFQGYGNGSAAVAASNRGSASRGGSTNQRRR